MKMEVFEENVNIDEDNQVVNATDDNENSVNEFNDENTSVDKIENRRVQSSSSSSSPSKIPQSQNTITSTTNNDLDDLFGEMDDDEAQTTNVKAERQTTQSILNLPEVSSFVNNASIFSIRTPNFMKFQPDEYDKESYDPSNETTKFNKASSVIRWRNKVDASGNILLSNDKKPIRESNARLVKWSDNTYQIIVGDKIYNVNISNLANWYVNFH